MKKLFTFMAVVFTALTLNAEPISVAQAIEACNALDANATSENEVTVEGFVVNAQDFSWGTNQQIWFMADDKDNTANQEFQAYYCTAEEDGNSVPVLNGDKVQLTGKLTKYVDKENKILLEIKNGKAAFVSKVDGDRSKPEAETITVAKALELGAGVDQGATSKVAYTIVGYVTAYEGKNADTDGGWSQYGNQIFWIADSKDSKAKSNADGAFEIYQGIPTEKVNIGDKVSVYTRIKNYNGILESEGRVPVTILEKGEGGQEEEKADVVFLPADFEGQGQAATIDNPGGSVSATKDGVTVTANNAYGYIALRIYKGSSFAITSEKEQIDKIVFKFANLSGKVYDGGLKEEVIVNGMEFKVNSLESQARIEEISIFFGEYEDEETPELPEGVITCAAAVELAASIDDPTEPKATVEGDAVKIRGYVTFAYDAKDGKQSAWLADKKGSKSGVLQGAYLEITDAVVVGDYVEIEGTLAKYLKEGKDGKPNEVIIEVINGTMRKAIGGKFIISTFVTPENAGQVTVLDNKLTATPNYGYHFVQWNDGNTDNPRTVELTKDTTFTAEFAINTSGSCGKDNLLTWTYDTQAKRLTISGNGSFDENMTCGLAKENMEELVIEEGVTSIGSKAFENCTNLTSIAIPNSVISIGDGAFSKCSNLTSVKLNSNAIVSKDYFYFDDDYWGVLPNIGSIFGTQVTKYIIGEDVTSIGSSAFENCTDLTSVTIPNSVTGIGNYAFYECTGLTSFEIPNSVTSIGDGAFYNCSGLTSPVYNAHVFAFMPTSCSGAYTIPDGIESIAGDAFYYCSGLTSIEIPNSVTSIGDEAFYGCTVLTSIEIPNSVTSIGSSAFYECTGLTSVTIGKSVANIGSKALGNCTGLSSVTINSNAIISKENSNSSSISSIFGTQVKEYIIGEAVTSIKNNAFYQCSLLTSVTIGNSVTSIGNFAFDGCSGLAKVNISDIAAWCNVEFENQKSNPLYYAHNLYLKGELVAELVIPDNVTSIGDYAFYNCASLTSAAIGNSVENIGNFAFISCYNLSSVTIPNSLKSIGNSAFKACSGLTSVTIPNKVTNMGNETFAGCIGMTSLTIGNSVTRIGGYVFAGCSGLTSVIIPNSVKSIEEYAFDHCTGLTSIEIPNSVTSIGAAAFSDCTGLTSATIGNGVTSIEDRAFYGCSHITELTLGKNLQSIGSEAFASCKRIADINCYAKSVPDIQANTFNDVSRKAYVWVAADQIRKYETDAYWGEFFIKTKEAEQATTSTVQVTSHETTADVVWPSVENAASYELVIKDKNGNAVCTLIFNANGQLTEIAFSAPSRDNAPQQPQATGFAFTITGLNSGTGYDLIITSKDKDGETLDEQTLSFTTQGDAPQSLDQITNDQLQTNKVIHNGQLLILRGDNTYTLTGQPVK